MSSLKSRLESVYTSGDRLTMLTLLKDLIDSLEGIEVVENALYEHKVTISWMNSPVPFSVTTGPVTVITKSSTPLTHSDLNGLQFVRSAISTDPSGLIAVANRNESSEKWAITQVTSSNVTMITKDDTDVTITDVVTQLI